MIDEIFINKLYGQRQVCKIYHVTAALRPPCIHHEDDNYKTYNIVHADTECLVLFLKAKGKPESPFIHHGPFLIVSGICNSSLK